MSWECGTSRTSWAFRTRDSSACVTRMSWKCQDMVEIPYAWEVVAVKLGCPGSVGTSRMSWHTHECLCVQRTFWNCPGTLGYPGHKDMSACVYQDILDTRTWVLVCTNLRTIKVLRITDCNLLVRTLWATTSPYAGSVHLREAVDANSLTAAASRLMCAHICLMVWLQRVISRPNVIWLKFRGWTGTSVGLLDQLFTSWLCTKCKDSWS